MKSSSIYGPKRCVLELQGKYSKRNPLYQKRNTLLVKGFRSEYRIVRDSTLRPDFFPFRLLQYQLPFDEITFSLHEVTSRPRNNGVNGESTEAQMRISARRAKQLMKRMKIDGTSLRGCPDISRVIRLRRPEDSRFQHTTNGYRCRR